MVKRKRSVWQMLSALLFSAALAVACDLIAAFLEAPLALWILGLIFGLSAALLIVLNLRTRNFWFWFVCLLVMGGLLLGGILYYFGSEAGYRVRDEGKAALYGGKNVLVLVPHQDDEILAAAGVMEEYLHYGSRVNLAFLTNGDQLCAGQTRLQEALAVAQAMGIPSKQVYFLGYGDRCIDGVHLYNLPEEQQIASPAGFDRTYALPEHPPYRDSAYTKANMRADLKDLVLELQADVIFCVEVEPHPDHSALSLLLDEVMAEILREEADYRPLLLKSSCYATNVYAADDFYRENLAATQNPSGGEFFFDVYNWEDRIRLPVRGDTLSRSIFGCSSYQLLRLHRSQAASANAENATNGDMVFWLRDTNSLLYRAQIETSSGNASFLNDFKLYDCYDVNSLGESRDLSDNTWRPEADDGEKTAVVTLPQAGYIQRICLYDDPSAKHNVLAACITFDDGSTLSTGALNRNGSATEIPVNKANVQSFTVQLLQTEGEKAGITEIEAYAGQADQGLDFIKLQDMDGNFVYDYFVPEKGSQNFILYTSGVEGPFRVSSDNPRCSVIYENGIVSVKCPKGQSCTLTVSTEDGQYADTVVISNPGRFLRETGPALEALVRRFLRENLQESSSYRVLRELYHKIA